MRAVPSWQNWVVALAVAPAGGEDWSMSGRPSAKEA